MSRITRSLVLFVLALLVIAVVPAFAQEATAEPSQVTVEVGADGMTVPAEMPAGIVRISFVNNSEAPFGPLLARLNEGVTQDALMEALSNGPEAALPLIALLGGTQIAPNTAFDVTFDLKPGVHVLLNFAGETPDVKTFTVAEGDAAADAPQADVQVSLMDFAFSLPTTISAGSHTWGLENKGGQWHEMAVGRLPDDMTVADYRKLLTSAASGGPEAAAGQLQEMFTWLPMQQGERAWFNLDLEPGTYLVVCFLPDFASGHAHADMGMEQIITVTE